MFCKKGVLRNFAKFTGKYLRQSLFFNKVGCLRAATLLKNRLWYRCFPVNLAKFLRTPFLKEHLRWLLLFSEDAISLRNFEFRKQCSIVNRRLSPEVFRVVSFFHERVSCVKHGTYRQFDRIKFVFKIWLNWREKSSIVDVQLGSKYASVSMTLHLEFLKCKVLFSQREIKS